MGAFTAVVSQTGSSRGMDLLIQEPLFYWRFGSASNLLPNQTCQSEQSPAVCDKFFLFLLFVLLTLHSQHLSLFWAPLCAQRRKLYSIISRCSGQVKVDSFTGSIRGCSFDLKGVDWVRACYLIIHDSICSKSKTLFKKMKDFWVQPTSSMCKHSPFLEQKDWPFCKSAKRTEGHLVL